MTTANIISVIASILAVALAPAAQEDAAQPQCKPVLIKEEKQILGRRLQRFELDRTYRDAVEVDKLTFPIKAEDCGDKTFFLVRKEEDMFLIKQGSIKLIEAEIGEPICPDTEEESRGVPGLGAARDPRCVD